MNIHTHRSLGAAICLLIVGSVWLAPPRAFAQSAGATAVIQETSTPVSYTGAWLHEDTQRYWSGGTAAIAVAAGAAATLTFTGVGVTWIGFYGPQAGIARVFLDGALVATVDLFAPAEQVRAPVFAAAALADSSHTLTVEVTGEKNPYSIGSVVAVDAFEITAGAAGIVDVTAPTVVFTWPAAGATVPTGMILRAKAVDDFAVTGVRFLVDDVDITNEASTAPYWIAWDTASVAEGAHTLTAAARDAAGNIGSTNIVVTVDRTPPAVVITSPPGGSTLSDLVTIAADVFDGVGVDRVWFSANGVSLGVDTTPPYQIVWDTTLIPDGSYTVEVGAQDRAGGLNRTAVTVTVWNGMTRIQENDSRIVYSGTWVHGNDHRAWSERTASIATDRMYSARATLPFDGTGVTWIGFRGPQAGIAHVYLDDVRIATVDLFDVVEHVQALVFEVRGLASGPHTVVVEATGTRNPLSSDPFVVVDSFIIHQR